MKSPYTGKQMSVVKEWRTMDFRKEKFDVLFHTFKCDDTGEQFEDDVFAQLNYNQLINQYRVKYSIPFPEQFTLIREKYDLPAIKMSKILGFGDNGYRQYESGDVPNQSNARLIQLAQDPHEFQKLVILSDIDQKSKEKIQKRIENLLEEQKKSKAEKQVEHYLLGNSLPSAQTGYRIPDLNRFAEMVVFFTRELQPWKTKLNKLLFYADFKAFRQSGFSISGMRYCAIDMGPVPDKFHSIFEYFANKDLLDIYYTPFSIGAMGEQFKPNPAKQFNPQVFTPAELSILQSVADTFKDTSTTQIIEISHQEKAWIENQKQKKIIDYKYGFELIH